MGGVEKGVAGGIETGEREGRGGGARTDTGKGESGMGKRREGLLPSPPHPHPGSSPVTRRSPPLSPFPLSAFVGTFFHPSHTKASFSALEHLK